MSAERRVLAAVLAISLLLKLGVAWIAGQTQPSAFLLPDSSSYTLSAQALLEHGTFAVSPAEPETPQTERTPGYPALLFLVYAVCGPRDAAVIAVQILLSLLTIGLVYGLVRRFWKGRTALVAAALLALDLASLVSTLQVLTEALFTLLLVMVLGAAARFQARPRAVDALGLGAALACAVLVRPIAYYIPVPLAVWLVTVAWRRGTGIRRGAVHLLLFILPILILVGGWQLRNSWRTGTPVFSRTEGRDLLYFRAAAVVARRDGVSFTEGRERLGWSGGHAPEPPPGMTLEAQSVVWKRQAIALIRAHPLQFLRVELEGAVRLFASTGDHTLIRLLGIPVPSTGPLGDLRRLDPASFAERWFLKRPGQLSTWALAMLHLAVLCLAAGTAAVRRVAKRQATFFDLAAAAIFAYLVMASAGPEAYHRYRVPLTPFLCVYAAVGLESWLTGLPRTWSMTD